MGFQGGLFATFCEKLGDPLKKESFTVDPPVGFPSKAAVTPAGQSGVRPRHMRHGSREPTQRARLSALRAAGAASCLGLPDSGAGAKGWEKLLGMCRDSGCIVLTSCHFLKFQLLFKTVLEAKKKFGLLFWTINSGSECQT